MKILLLASFATKKYQLGGEHKKSAAIAEALAREHVVYRCNLSTKWCQPFVMARFLYKAKHGHFDKIFICKAPTGCSLAMTCLEKERVDPKKVILYPYGKGLEGPYATNPKLRKRLNYACFREAGALIVENERSAVSYKAIGCTKIFFLPVVKEIFNLPESKIYHEQTTLKAIFWARIVESKGVLLALRAIQQINEEAGFRKYSLDIAGGYQEKNVENEIIEQTRKDKSIRYFGTSFSADGIESYRRLQEYDIHVFPTFFEHECAPGSLVDMFIAGVPTLSSTFPGYESMLTDKTSYFVPQKDLEALVQKLKYIYDHQKELFDKRALVRGEAQKYSYDAFLTFFDGNFS